MNNSLTFIFSTSLSLESRLGFRSYASVETFRRQRISGRERSKLRKYFTCNLGSPSMLPTKPTDGHSDSSCLERLNNWLCKANVELINCEIHAENGSRGVYATDTIKKDEDIFKIPHKAALIVSSVSKSASDDLHIFSIRSDEFWSSEPWYIRLAIKLLDEVARGDRSPFAPYINVLPRASNAALWAVQASRKDGTNTDATSAVEQQLAKYGLLHATRTYESQIRKSFESFHSALPERQKEYVTLRSFTWAVCIVVSRGFGVPPSSGVSQDINYPSGDISIPIVAKAGFHLNPPAYALFPGLDMTNHSIHAATELRYDDNEDLFYIRTGRTTPPGKEVFVSYGKKCNDDLVFFYGFSEGRSPYNEIRIYDTEDWGHQLLNDRNSGTETTSRTRKLDIIRDAELLKSGSCFILRSDKLDDDMMRLLRVIVATPGELDAINQCSHQSQIKHNSLYSALSKAISLRNELEAWLIIESCCESMIKSQGGKFTDIERQRVAELLQDQYDKNGDACSAVWIWGEADSDGELLFRWERALILEEIINRVRHFAHISRTIGRVCTVLLPPSQLTLRTEAFQPLHNGGLPTFEVSPDEIQEQIRGS